MYDKLSKDEQYKRTGNYIEDVRRINEMQSRIEEEILNEIVRLLIDKVIVSEKVKTEDGYKRTVTICFTHVGEIELP